MSAEDLKAARSALKTAASRLRLAAKCWKRGDCSGFRDAVRDAGSSASMAEWWYKRAGREGSSRITQAKALRREAIKMERHGANRCGYVPTMLSGVRRKR